MNRTKASGECIDAASRRGPASALAMAVLLAASCSANVAAPSPAGHAGTGAGTLGTAGTAGGTTGTGGININVSDAGRGEAGPTEDANCGLQNYALDRRPAIVVLLQDRSTSMRNTLTGGATRWATLFDSVKPSRQQTQAGISWGFK